MTAYEMRSSDWSSDVCSSDLRSLAESPDPDQRLRCRKNAGAGARGFKHKLLRAVDVSVIGNADRHMDAHVPAGKTPVFNLLGHEIFVRNQMFLAVSRDDRNRPDTDLVDPSEAAADSQEERQVGKGG